MYVSVSSAPPLNPFKIKDFPSGSDGKESACCAGDQGSVCWLGGSPGEGSDNLLQYFCLETEEPSRL